MTFNTHDVILLRLIGRCKSLPRSVLENYPVFPLLTVSDLSALFEWRLMYQSRRDGSLRLTQLGYDVAGRLGGELHRDRQ